MEHYASIMFDFILPMKDIYLYFFLFLSAIVENLFPPIPGDTITAFGAFLVGTGRLNYFIVYITTTIGSTIGFNILFLFAKHFGRKYFYEKHSKIFSIDKIEKTESWIKKYGYFIIFANRFVPGIRSVISIVSGISNLKTFRVIILSFIGASIWNLLWIHAGYLLGSNWDIVKERFTSIMKQYNLIGGIIIAVVIVFVILRYVKKRKND